MFCIFVEKNFANLSVIKKERIPDINITAKVKINISFDKIPIISWIATVAPVRVLAIA